MWLWSKLSASKWMDAWEDRFRGNPNFVMQILKGGKSVRLRVYCGTKKEADAIIEQFGGEAHPMKENDWVSEQKKTPPPIKVRDVFLVTGEQDKKLLKAMREENPKRTILHIPPEMAFGTGDHPTTSTCLRLLVDVARERGNKGDWTVADLGTGTGVLAIAARILGSGKAYACDFDPFAVDVTQRNVTRNGVDGIDVAQQDVLKWKPKKPYDVVLANLFSTVLIEAMPVLAKTLAPGGTLIVSGILATQAWDVVTAAAGYGIGFSKVVRRGKWVTARGGWMEDLAKLQ